MSHPTLRILSVIPPMTQLNTPYPSTAYLTGFLRARNFSANQVDLALALVLELFSPAGLVAMRDRIRSHGVNVLGPIDHGMCRSIYFAGPDQMTLEVATSQKAIDADSWIDPAVLAKAGISGEEAARFRAPAAYAGPSPVPQPAYDPAKPHMAYPKEMYLQMLKAPDEAITAAGSYPNPPVAVRA